MNRFLAHALAIGAALAAMIVISAVWIFHLREGAALEGFSGGPMALAAPAAILILSGIWLVLRALIAQLAKLPVVNAVVFCIGISYITIAIVCGPIACFQPGPHRLLGWFVVAGVALAAFVHHVVLTWLRRGDDTNTPAST